MECGLTCHDEWVALPLEPGADISGWAQTQAHVLVERSKAADLPSEPALLTQDLRERAADSRGRAPVLAFALYLPGVPHAAAVLEVEVIRPDEDVPSPDLEWFEATFSSPDFGPSQVDRARLPAGPALRLRQNLASPRAEADGSRLLMETLTYAVAPAGSDMLVLMLVSWTVPGVADLVETMADDIARTLEVRGTSAGPS